MKTVYYNDKHCGHIAYLDYINPRDTEKDKIIDPKELSDLLYKTYCDYKPDYRFV